MHHSRTSARRWMGRIAVCCVLGVVMTVASAWIVAATVRPFTGPVAYWSRPSGIGDGWSYWVGRDLGTVEIMRVRAMFRMQPPLREDYLAVRKREVPAWSAVYVAPRDSDAMGTTYTEEARGWPWPALYSELIVAPASGGGRTIATHGGVVLRASAASASDRVTLPMRPIWSAFAIDALLFSTIAFTLLFAPGMLRRSLRRRSARCERCGYDLRGGAGVGAQVCPECGSATIETAAGKSTG